jgi:cytidyltransferase-like protein
LRCGVFRIFSVSRMCTVLASISFDDPRSQGIRFLEEAAGFGDLHVVLWSDEQVRAATGAGPKFPFAERRYYLENLRHVAGIAVVEGELPVLPEIPGVEAKVWVVAENDRSADAEAAAVERGIRYEVISNRDLDAFPDASLEPKPVRAGRKKVLVTGCYDWFHSGHVRFFEEVSELGDVYAVVGHDANIALLKGAHHPMFKQDERRYIVSSLKTVHQAFISTGRGYLDAAPEIERIQPDIYAVNEDGDKGGKEAFCREKGIDYAVLRRTPKEGLTKRSSTGLRGF